MQAALQFKIADSAQEFEAIHRLNYRTFVEEIPQHAANAEQRLVDRFHAENRYAICLHEGRVVGMIAGRCERPFSLEGKLPDLARYLPPHQKAVEIRLLAVEPEFRHQAVFARLAGVLGVHFRGLGCDLALISGTVRQLKLYAHLGFQSFGPLVGSEEARYQPMFLRLPDYATQVAHLELTADGEAASFLPGPVAISPAVAAAWSEPPLSHRSPAHLQRLARVRERLCAMTGSHDALIFPGSGTLANDAVAGQLSLDGRPGLVIANGEFGERLADHARRWRLPHRVLRLGWGEALTAERLQAALHEHRPAWLWAALCETSTGMDNGLALLRDACTQAGADLCLDAVSALGLQPLDLRGVWLASAVSGKALGAYAGLAIVLHDGRLAAPGQLPRSLDLAAFSVAGGVPYTQGSNGLAALEAALKIDWPARWQATREADAFLRAELAALGLPPLLSSAQAMPGVITLALPPGQNAARLGQRLERYGCKLAYQSAYLRERNWLQICLMGDWQRRAVEVLPQLLARRLRGLTETPEKVDAQ